jgi:predicted Zn-dependent protease
VIARVLLVVAALTAAAWVGASLRSAQLESQARSEIRTALGGGPNRGQGAAVRRFRRERISDAADLLDRARKWAPYQAPIISEAGLLSTIGRQRRAVELLDDLVRREPDNPEAWGRLADVLERSDPARARVARRRQQELIPPVQRP